MKEDPMKTRTLTSVGGLLLVTLVLLPGIALAQPTPPVPYIQEVSPPSATTPASVDVTLTITGTNFSDGTLAPVSGTPLSNVQFGSLSITTPTPVAASCSSGICTQLKVTVPMASIV